MVKEIARSDKLIYVGTLNSWLTSFVFELFRADGYPLGTPNACELKQCQRRKSNKFVVPLVVSLTASLVILAALIVIWKLRRTKRQGRTMFVHCNHLHIHGPHYYVMLCFSQQK